MGGGTEAFPDLGRHCQYPECNQLDFLPFKCTACRNVFCLEHRTYKAHDCPKSDIGSRKVLVCDICSSSIETTGHNVEEEKMILERHEKSGNCDPRKKKKPTCPVRGCKETLTFSNTTVCKTCHLKLCLKHRFPADHACKHNSALSPGVSPKSLVAWSSRNGSDCGRNGSPKISPPATPTVKSY